MSFTYALTVSDEQHLPKRRLLTSSGNLYAVEVSSASALTAENSTCPICLEPHYDEEYPAGADDPIRLHSTHNFGRGCLTTWFSSPDNTGCPLCRLDTIIKLGPGTAKLVSKVHNFLDRQPDAEHPEVDRVSDRECRRLFDDLWLLSKDALESVKPVNVEFLRQTIAELLASRIGWYDEGAP